MGTPRSLNYKVPITTTTLFFFFVSSIIWDRDSIFDFNFLLRYQGWWRHSRSNVYGLQWPLDEMKFVYFYWFVYNRTFMVTSIRTEKQGDWRSLANYVNKPSLNEPIKVVTDSTWFAVSAAAMRTCHQKPSQRSRSTEKMLLWKMTTILLNTGR